MVPDTAPEPPWPGNCIAPEQLWPFCVICQVKLPVLEADEEEQGEPSHGTLRFSHTRETHPPTGPADTTSRPHGPGGPLTSVEVAEELVRAGHDWKARERQRGGGRLSVFVLDSASGLVIFK
jgi:hypothetical protein